MNRKIKVSSAIIVFVFLATLGYAQDYGKKSKSSSGVETKKSGGANVLVPKGSKLIKKDGATFVEGLREYTSRKFTEVEARVKNLESQNAQLKGELEELKKTVADMQKQLLVSGQKGQIMQAGEK